jgi:phospholipid-transporting ATPase
MVYVNDPVKQRQIKYLHNSVTTGKYNAVTFLPRFLIEFFSKSANVFFLFTGSIQLIGTLSPTSKYGTIIPLTVIAIFSGGKEFVEDSKRHAQDRMVNSRLSKVLKGDQFIPTYWRDIKVGDVVRIENTEYFPADLVVISSSEPDALCYIETANLDGETNLKIRQGIPETAGMLSPESASKLDGVLKTELPNNSLYTFEAVLKFGGKEYPISPQQLLLRGAQLRNTRWVYAIAVFTGHETKLMMNSSATPNKRTKIERMINYEIIFLFLVLVSIALIGATGQLLVEVKLCM